MKILKIIKCELKVWFVNSKLKGLYIVGSYSTGEENEMSDIDLLGISNTTLNSDEIYKLRIQLKDTLRHNFQYDKIGFRIRSIQELENFQYKAKSWGYDLFNAKKIYGINLSIIIKPTNLVPIDPKEIFDNLIEKQWHDLLFINDSESNKVNTYLSAKSILDMLNFLLYFNGVFIPTNIGRIKYINKNMHLIDGLSITASDFNNSFNIKKNPELYQYNNINSIRFNLLKDMYQLFFKTFCKNANKYKESDYWGYSSKYFKQINKIYSNSIFINNKNLAKEYQSQHFIWRIILMEIFLKLDNNNIVNINSNLISDISNILLVHAEQYETKNDLLQELENIRIKTSKIGKDFKKH